MTKLVKIAVLGFIALGFSACGDNVVKRISITRSEIDSMQKIIATKIWADNIDTKKPTAPNGKSWGEWIMEVAELDNAKWVVVQNGVAFKDCNKGETPLITIDNNYMYFNPSKIVGEGKMEAFCKGLSESYRNDISNGDKKIPLNETGCFSF